MKWSEGRTWMAMLDWCTRLHDGIYPTSSPTPTPKLTGCREPTKRCKALAIYQDGGMGQSYCTVPHIPCPMQIEDYKEGHTAQTSKEARTPGVKTDSAKAIMDWTARTLEAISTSEAPLEVSRYAASLLVDSDESVAIQTAQALGEEMLRRLGEDMPWKRV